MENETRRITVVVNPSARKGEGVTASVHELVPRATVLEIGDDLPLDDALRRAEDADVIGIAGGDGTVSAAAAAAVENARPLLVVPAGTLNHFARDAGIDDAEQAAAALALDRTIAVDVGRVAGRAFLNTVGFGSYPELVDRRERWEKRIGKLPALVVALVGVLWSAEPVAVAVDGRKRRIWTGFVGNCRYTSLGLVAAGRDRLDDGLFDLRLVDADLRFSRLRLLGAFLTGRLRRSPVYERTVVERIELRFEAPAPIRLAADGETFDAPQVVVVAKDERRLDVFA